MTISVLPYGDRALLLEVADAAQALALHRTVLDRDLPGIVESVPAARTVLVTFDAPAACTRAARWLPDLRPVQLGPTDRAVVEIAVVYDGQDLPQVAESCGMSVEEVIRRHTQAEYETAFVGFAPGFAYLTGLDPRLQLPRHATPRTSVPTGSVAIAGEFAAVYPSASPGGWQLLGRTDARVFDVHRTPPALLTAGTRVRFRQVAP